MPAVGSLEAVLVRVLVSVLVKILAPSCDRHQVLCHEFRASIAEVENGLVIFITQALNHEHDLKAQGGGIY